MRIDPTPQNTPPFTTSEDKILSAWRKCAANQLPDGSVVVDSAVFEMMEAFIESVEEFETIIQSMNKPVNPTIHQSPQITHSLPPKPTRSWATVTKTPHPMILPMSVQAKPAANKVVNEYKAAEVVIRVPENNDLFANITSKELLRKVNAALLSVGAKINGNPIQALGASRMQSGDLMIHTGNRPSAHWILGNRHEWTSVVHKEFKTSRPNYPVPPQSVPSSYNPPSPSFTQELISQNRLPVESIQDCRWLIKPLGNKKHGSVIVSLLDKDLANKIGRGDLFLDGLCLPGKKFERSPIQCHQCQGIGHVARLCRHPAVCARCGEGHNTRECMNKDI